MQVDIEERLKGWGRWCRVRLGPATCASIEGRYRRRYRADDTTEGWGNWLLCPPAQYQGPVNQLEALEVERTMRHLYRKHSKALKLTYVFLLPSTMVCRRIAIPHILWHSFIYYAKCCVENRLTLKKHSIILAVHSELPNLPRLTRDLEPIGSRCNGVEELSSLA